MWAHLLTLHLLSSDLMSGKIDLLLFSYSVFSFSLNLAFSFLAEHYSSSLVPHPLLPPHYHPAPVVELGCAALLKVKFRLAEVSFGAVTSLACSAVGKRDPHYKIETSTVEVRSPITLVPLNVCSIHLS